MEKQAEVTAGRSRTASTRPGLEEVLAEVAACRGMSRSTGAMVCRGEEWRVRSEVVAQEW